MILSSCLLGLLISDFRWIVYRHFSESSNPILCSSVCPTFVSNGAWDHLGALHLAIHPCFHLLFYRLIRDGL